jgi:lipopolysaccharide export system protein LptC
MFYRTAFKWLTITIIVLVAFLIVLLFLGYLLKENEVKTTLLKKQLEHEAYQQQEKDSRKNSPRSHFPAGLSSLEKSQQKIIADNRSCQTDKQCFLINTHSQTLGCTVAVNTKGAAILLKVSSKSEIQPFKRDQCQLEYSQQQAMSAQCHNSLCTF